MQAEKDLIGVGTPVVKGNPEFDHGLALYIVI
jgi:hypothetical protein